MLQINNARRIAFRQFASQKTLLLFCENLIDKSFLGLEIIGHGITLIGIFTHVELWCAYQFFGHRVFDGTCCMNHTTVHVQKNLFTLQIHGFVFYR